MFRKKVSLLLDAYAPTTEEEIYKKKILSFITKHPNCFDRSLIEGHITASAWLLNKTETAALLLHHAKLNIWVQPGGHCDNNPDVFAVAIKEAQEESGIIAIEPITQTVFDIDIHKIPAYKNIAEHLHYDICFLLKVISDEQLIQNEESKELRWIAKDGTNLPPIDRSILRKIKKWKKL